MRHEEQASPGRWTSPAVVIVAVVLPLALLVVLRWRPTLDVTWQNHPAHFWLVLAAAAVAITLGHAVASAARQRQDARLFLIALAFIAGAGFLGLHALATPGVMIGPNAGFEFATPAGLVLGSGLVALSAMEFSPRTSQRIMARSRLMLAGLVALLAGWAIASLTGLPPLDDPLQGEQLQGVQLAFAGVGVVGYGIGTLGYLRLFRRRGARFAFTVALAFALLTVTMIVIAFAANWRLSWWEWHVLMLAAFGLIAMAAREEWHQERFSALYLEQTLAGVREASILFADLQGFTTFSERTDPATVQRMLNTYLAQLVPLMRRFDGDVHQLIGDAVMVVFGTSGDDEHALSAARAALAFQDVAAEVAGPHPDWPRFRVGVNSGEVATGVLGDHGHRKFDVIGDTVNLAARLEAQAPVGAVVVGEGTRRHLPESAVVEPLPPLQVKGKSAPVTAYILRAIGDQGPL